MQHMQSLAHHNPRSPGQDTVFEGKYFVLYSVVLTVRLSWAWCNCYCQRTTAMSTSHHKNNTWKI